MSKKYTTLLFDFDDTLFDFPASSKFALKKTFEQYDLTFTEQCMELFERINKQVWEAYERGEYTKEQILLLRFAMMFNGTDIDCKAFNTVYLDNMCKAIFPFEGTYEICEKLCKSYDMYIVTNSVEKVNVSRMNLSGMDKYFIKSFISDAIGAAKPSRQFFDYVFDNINEKDKSKVLIIGDSLTSDIQGGINSGIDTCWFNRRGNNTTNLNPTYIVHNYNELEELLQQ